MWNTWRDFKAGRWVCVKSLIIWIFMITLYMTTEKGAAATASCGILRVPFLSVKWLGREEIKQTCSICCICGLCYFTQGPLLTFLTTFGLEGSDLSLDVDFFRQTKTFCFLIFSDVLAFFNFFIHKKVYTLSDIPVELKLLYVFSNLSALQITPLLQRVAQWQNFIYCNYCTRVLLRTRVCHNFCSFMIH